MFEAHVTFHQRRGNRDDLPSDRDVSGGVASHGGDDAVSRAEIEGDRLSAGVDARARERGFAMAEVEADDFGVLVQSGVSGGKAVQWEGRAVQTPRLA